MDQFLRSCSLLLLCALLTACDNTTAQEHTDNGRDRLAEGELRAAVIELKNALQKAPDLAEARLLLGNAHQQLGDHPRALKEFERALDLGLDNEPVRLGLLRSKVRLERYQEVIGELEGKGALTPPFAVVLADAYLNAGDTERAEALYRQGEHLSQGNVGLGMIAWRKGDLERAAQHLAAAVRLDPENWEAWLRKGEFDLGRGALGEAEAAFSEALDLPAARVMGRVGLARVELSRGDLESATAEVQRLLKVAPHFLGAHYLDGLVRFQQQDLEGAEAALRQVQRSVPDHPPSLYLMGAIKYRQGQLAQAESNLQRYLAQDPTSDSAAKLLASARFDQGDHQGVVDTLGPRAAGTSDPQLLAMLGTAHMLLGNPTEASRFLEQSVELAPDMAPFRNQLALSLLAAGDRSGAEAELASAIDVDGEQFQSDYLLAMVRVREGEWEAAGEAVEDLIAKSPDNPIGYNLRGAVALGTEDRAAARAAFEQALEVDASFLPAVRNLASLEEAEGDRAQAAKLYRDFLEIHEGHEDALVALAELALRDRDPEAAIGHLERSLDSNPDAVRSGLGLGRLYLASGRLKDADRVVTGLLDEAGELPDLLLLKAEIDLRSGDTEGASRAAARLQGQVAGGNDNPKLMLALGRLQAQVGKGALARRNLQAALQAADGDEPAALASLVRLELGDGNLEAARTRLEALKRLAGDDAGTRLLEADVLMAENRRSDAREIYAALAGEGLRDGVLRLATLDVAEGRIDAAMETLDDWLGKHPQDLGAQLLSADVLMRADRDRAVDRYESMVETGNPVVLNNLAWLYMERQDPRAVEMARRAAEAAPSDPDVLDTLGWVLLQQGEDTAEAVRTLRRSVQLNPDNPSVQYHLGVALREVGDTEGARSAFSAALDGGNDFPEVGEAREALATL